MKILITADIHIKLSQKKVPKDWARNRYDMFLAQLAEAEREVDLVVIPGDIFDRVPTLEELEIYFRLVSERTVETIIGTGNHEAAKKGVSFFEQLKDVTEKLNPLVRVITRPHTEGNYHIIPYEYIKDEKMWESLDPSYAVFTHVRGAIEPHVKPEIPLEWLDKFPVVFAGDLHSHSNTQRNIVYPGSPMTTSFHRNRVDTGYLIADSEDWSWSWHKFNLPQLIRKTVSDPSEMIPTDFDHTVYELEGTLKDLSQVENSELLDKKVVKRSSQTTLLLKRDQPVAEKLKTYLERVMQLPNGQLEEVMGVFNEYGSTENA